MAATSFKISDLVSKLSAEDVGHGDSEVADEGCDCSLHGQEGPLRSIRGPRDRAHDQSNVAFATSEVSIRDSWVMDSGASAHMCKDRDALEEYTEVQHSRSMSSAKSDVKL
ncbi:unnamed protein product [Peronospora belbahrii]|uniref:Retrovirus-related Pol polyprotein from transposon TNT 1-94-like beta-barrel domain-containing protein n=1 Tax=Peronospora belbahrii TaxID=622444 RepID=A0AAU9KQG7_9STRA|nr:unnamed protein product [Peronospora belbahrii]